MTIGTILMRRGAIPGGVPAAAIAVLLLAGCSSGHIGEDWQCPLATGGSCHSTAMADPAVPKPASVQRRAPGEPIRLLPLEASPIGADTPPNRGPGQASVETGPCEAACDGFDPFGWLERLFGGKGQEETGSARTAAQPSFRSGDIEERPAEPPTASLPGEPDTDTGEPASGNAQAGGLRTDETVARIWIAPFVDADGIYREAAHVRVVLEPAGWRLR